MRKSRFDFKECPVCGETRVTDTFVLTDYKITNWAIHIKGRARSELFNKEFIDKRTLMPHVKWLHKNAKLIRKSNNFIIINAQ